MLTARLVKHLPILYGWVKKRGLLDRPAFRRVSVACYFLYKRHLEDPFLPLVRAFPAFFTRGHILDVGANIGYTADVFRRALGPGFRVWAFEPDATNFAMLEDTVRGRGPAAAIVPVHAAVGDRDGTVDLWHNEAHHGDHRVATPEFRSVIGNGPQTTPVPQVTLDSFTRARGIERAIGFVKIDVQGYELPVCRGMTGILDHNPEARVAIEYAPEAMRELGFDPHELLRMFRERGYRLHVIRRNGRLVPVTFEALDGQLVATEKGYLDLLCARATRDASA